MKNKRRITGFVPKCRVFKWTSNTSPSFHSDIAMLILSKIVLLSQILETFQGLQRSAFGHYTTNILNHWLYKANFWSLSVGTVQYLAFLLATLSISLVGWVCPELLKEEGNQPDKKAKPFPLRNKALEIKQRGEESKAGSCEFVTVLAVVNNSFISQN